ncbi:hypothetical protein HanPSC8_Chr06g0234691 [Helianthus annuus]|nr:hypothetical protein HanPSC8_Chr06g0234691 [Helianthus annuus]
MRYLKVCHRNHVGGRKNKLPFRHLVYVHHYTCCNNKQGVS